MRKFGERKVWLVSVDEEGQLKPYEVKVFPLCKMGVIKHLLLTENVGDEHITLNSNRYVILFDKNSSKNLKDLLISKTNSKNVVMDMEDNDYPIISYVKNKYFL